MGPRSSVNAGRDPGCAGWAKGFLGERLPPDEQRGVQGVKPDGGLGLQRHELPPPYETPLGFWVCFVIVTYRRCASTLGYDISSPSGYFLI